MADVCNDDRMKPGVMSRLVFLLAKLRNVSDGVAIFSKISVANVKWRHDYIKSMQNSLLTPPSFKDDVSIHVLQIGQLAP